MSSTPGPIRPQGTEQQFTVPVPVAPANPYAGQPVWPAPAQWGGGAQWGSGAHSGAVGQAARPAEDPLIAQVGTALLVSVDRGRRSPLAVTSVVVAAATVGIAVARAAVSRSR